VVKYSVRFFGRLVFIGLILYLAAWAYRIYLRKYYVWLPGYWSWTRESEAPATGPVHLFFIYVDHFEPGPTYHFVQRWLDEYPKLAERHRDADGRPVQHTWFYPAEQPIDRNMLALQKLVADGYGEVELHLHHDHDTAETGRERFASGIAYLQKFGFLKTPDGAPHFAFIHGNWGLDNSRGPAYCGNNEELRMLRELGCFADFTFPSLYWESQPPFVNNIYAATDDPRPKSYDRGVPVQQGVPFRGDLMIFQGPLLLVPNIHPRWLFVMVEDDDIHPAIPVDPTRVDHWVRSRIHVKGRPDWQFLKVHTHGAQSDADASETLGPHFDSALSHLETAYNDRTHYILHYVTAREAFNLVRAAIDGKRGDPRQYYDYVIPPYIADRPVPALSGMASDSAAGASRK
jgi:hypothetical protein